MKLTPQMEESFLALRLAIQETEKAMYNYSCLYFCEKGEDGFLPYFSVMYEVEAGICEGSREEVLLWLKGRWDEAEAKARRLYINANKRG
jgi:hypothetical protein